MPRRRLYGAESSTQARLASVVGRFAGPAAYLLDRATVGRQYSNKVAAYIREHRVDLAHLNNWPLLNDGSLAGARAAGVPSLMHVRGFEYSGRLVGWLARRADHVVAISRYIASTLLELGVAEQRLTVVPNAIDAEAFASGADGERFRRSIGLPLGRPLIGMVAGFVPWKGHSVFLRACAEIFKTVDGQAVIVGASPDHSSTMKDELAALAVSLGIADRVCFAGHCRDVASAMDACDLLVHASTAPEPFGRVIIEAMALGKPVIATSPGGPAEIVSHEIDGLLVPPGEARSIAAGAIALLADPEGSRRMGERGRAKILAHYSIPKHVEQIADLYDRLI